ncbi:unnamed protein product [Gongylonema pulchrum]|uniref:Aha1_N domain-containing protein n=1 Tax=Gongylonema pulchrum TaxID=637853 RepID=A0A183DEC3_9BILA|nr:unnamed protein product [Gongylonema pulchrum]
MTRGLTFKVEICSEPWEDGLEEWSRKQNNLRGVLRSVLDGKSVVDDEDREANPGWNAPSGPVRLQVFALFVLQRDRKESK